MAESGKTKRILNIFHLLRYSDEVSFKFVIQSTYVDVCKKTVYRDIRLLRQLGFQIEFKKKLKAFVMPSDKPTEPPCFPENKTQRLYLQKILRLIRMMCEMDAAADPAAWYRENYPDLSVRTMQRDFKILNYIGYFVEYRRGVYERGELQNKYCCDYPYGVY